MVALNDIFEKVTDDWVSRVILDEVVVMPLCRNSEDVQYIYSISNETGTRIWQLLDGSHSTKEIQEILKSEYRGKEELIERNVVEFLNDILEAGLTKKSNSKRLSPESKQSSDNSQSSEKKKKPYKSPEIAKVKMQPEQAVLACCAIYGDVKTSGTRNRCGNCTTPGTCTQATELDWINVASVS